jgi:4'-phosphopantetheinyl transferase
MIASRIYRPFSPPEPLPGDALQVWHILLDQAQEDVPYFSSLLSPDEKERAGRFYFERDRSRYILGRGILRTLLAAHLNLEPAQIRFSYGPCGKPALKSTRGENAPQFNISHSGNLLMVAFCQEHRVGIDVEQVRLVADELRLAEEFFSPGESKWISSLNGARRRAAFFKLWTCKEALVKASGIGLAEIKEQMEIQLAEQNHPRLVSIDGSREESDLWRLQTGEPVPGYQAALAVEII